MKGVKKRRLGLDRFNEGQVPRDRSGKKRFHGAFSGGFSAGYHNTVGSAEGWSPAPFMSSRNCGNGAHNVVQRAPNYYMDEEDEANINIYARSDFNLHLPDLNPVGMKLLTKSLFVDTVGKSGEEIIFATPKSNLHGVGYTGAIKLHQTLSNEGYNHEIVSSSDSDDAKGSLFAEDIMQTYPLKISTRTKHALKGFCVTEEDAPLNMTNKGIFEEQPITKTNKMHK